MNNEERGKFQNAGGMFELEIEKQLHDNRKKKVKDLYKSKNWANWAEWSD